VGGVEHVDVDRDVDGPVGEAGAHALDDAREPVELVVVAADHLEAEDAVVAEVLGRVERAADADVHAALAVDQPFLGGAPERGAVRGGAPK
jgi:hypothetical protein